MTTSKTNIKNKKQETPSLSRAILLVIAVLIIWLVTYLTGGMGNSSRDPSPYKRSWMPPDAPPNFQGPSGPPEITEPSEPPPGY